MLRNAASIHERMDREFLVALVAGQARLRERDSDTAQIMPDSESTYYRRKRGPEKFAVQDVRILAQRYKFTDYQLCQIFGVKYCGRTTESEAV